MKVEGVIDSITSRTVSNGGTVWTAVIDGAEVNLGFTCDYKEGEYASIEVESTKWGLQVPRKSSKPTGGQARSQGSGATSRPTVGSATNKQFPVNPDSKDHIIIRQNALTNANAAVATAVAAGVKFKTAEDVYNEVIKVAYNLTGFAMGTMDKALVEQARKQAAAATAKLADEETSGE